MQVQACPAAGCLDAYVARRNQHKTWRRPTVQAVRRPWRPTPAELTTVETDLGRVAGTHDGGTLPGAARRWRAVTDGLPLLGAWAIFAVMVLALAVMLTRGRRR